MNNTRNSPTSLNLDYTSPADSVTMDADVSKSTTDTPQNIASETDNKGEYLECNNVKFNTRMTSMTIDTLVLCIVISPVLIFLFSVKFNGISLDDVGEIVSKAKLSSSVTTQIILQYVIVQLINMLISAALVLMCWRRGVTPGKFVTRTVLLNQATMTPPDTKQCLIRMAAFAFSILPFAAAFLMLPFTKESPMLLLLVALFLMLGVGLFILPFLIKKRGLHDILANTVVIKKVTTC